MSTMRVSIVSVGLFGLLAMLPLNLAKADQVGHASWYSFHSRTASGARMDPGAMTAAHPSLPFGTKVLVQNLSNGRSVTVTINDRGPFVHGRIIDVSKAAAASLGMIGSGTAMVRISTGGGGGHMFGHGSNGLLHAASDVEDRASSRGRHHHVASYRLRTGRSAHEHYASYAHRSRHYAHYASLTRHRSTRYSEHERSHGRFGGVADLAHPRSID